MIKKTTLILFACTLAIFAYSQDVKKEAQKIETKMEAFASKTGIIVKFIDTKLTPVKLLYGSVAETRVRKIITGSEARYFYQIENQGKYNSSTASIDYTDLQEIIKAIKNLKPEAEKDVIVNPDYLENKFTTTDGFQVGYFVSKGKVSWYLRLEKYGSDNTIFVKDAETIDEAFVEAKNKIDELQKIK